MSRLGLCLAYYETSVSLLGGGGVDVRGTFSGDMHMHIIIQHTNTEPADRKTDPGGKSTTHDIVGVSFWLASSGGHSKAQQQQ